VSRTLGQWLRLARDALVVSGSDSPGLDAEILAAHALSRNRAWLLAHRDDELTESDRCELQALLDARLHGVPVAYLTGSREFWSLRLKVSPDVLIPRPETELLVEQALERMPGGGCRILDLGTGSGAIALALATERPDADVVAVERSGAALSLARDNALALGLDHVRFILSDWFGGLDDKPFDLIVANPPYVDPADPCLDGEIRHEPRQALVSGDNGLADLDKIISGAVRYLHPAGWLLVEHGCDQEARVSALFRRSGFSDVVTHRDLAGLDRTTGGRVD
jgi:release factor glutamine methyltransferase